MELNVMIVARWHHLSIFAKAKKLPVQQLFTQATKAYDTHSGLLSLVFTYHDLAKQLQDHLYKAGLGDVKNSKHPKSIDIVQGRPTYYSIKMTRDEYNALM